MFMFDSNNDAVTLVRHREIGDSHFVSTTQRSLLLKLVNFGVEGEGQMLFHVRFPGMEDVHFAVSSCAIHDILNAPALFADAYPSLFSTEGVFCLFHIALSVSGCCQRNIFYTKIHCGPI